MSDKILASVSLVSMVFLVAMINLTTPSEIGPLGVLVFFTLVYAVCLGMSVGACRLFFVTKDKLAKRKVGGSKKRSYFYGTILAFAPIILIFMRSFGSLNLLGIILVVILEVLACFYVSKRA